MKKEKQPSTRPLDDTKGNLPSEQENPTRINNTKEMLGKTIIFSAAPPAAKEDASGETLQR
jgi:hypothetical protein